MGETAPTRNPAQEFNLTKRFAVYSFVCVGILTAALWLTVSSYLTKETLDREWETTAKFVRKESRRWVEPADFKTLDFHAIAPRFQKLHEEITMVPGIARIKVYNAQGAILWSDEQRLVGAAFGDNPELKEALGGKVVADLSWASKKENIYEQDSSQGLVEVYVPIFSEDGKEVVGVIETYKHAEPLFGDVRKARLVVLAATLAGGVFLYLSLFALVRRAARKIDEQHRNLLAMQSELNASQRMAAVGEMAAAIAHGIGNPLSSIRAAAQVAKIDCAEQNSCEPSERTQSNLQNIIQQVDRVQKRMRGLLNFVSPLEPHPAPVKLNSLLQDAAESLRSRFEEAGVHCRLELDRNVPDTRLDPNHLEQVFTGLLTNALEATPRGGRITIGTKVGPVAGNSRGVTILFEDTGEGIPIENRERVFEPFFTTKPHGTGIGLPLAKKFVEKNGGEIYFADGSEGGTRVEVTFPFNQRS